MGIYYGRMHVGGDSIYHGKLPGDKSGGGESREEFENRIVSGE